MLSLRARLTLSYAFLIGVFLTTIAIFAGRLFIESRIHHIDDAMESSASRIRIIVAQHPVARSDVLKPMILTQASRPEVTLRLFPPALPDVRRPNPWAVLFGLRRIRVPFNGGFADVMSDQDYLEPIARNFAEIFALIGLIIVVVSWWVAQFFTREAIRPLILVTDELRRFSSGDFTPRAVTKIDRDEFGELSSAYNAAAAQVAAAFDEHLRVEEQMKRFVADASHELRTPITVISGYLDILKRMDPADAAGHERAFRTLNVETRRVRLLVDRLVALARLEQTERAQREVLDMRTVINDVLLEISVARAVTVELTVTNDFSILADLADVYDSIRNLVENSVKYGENSPVTVEIFCTEEHGCVRVRDAGPGIPEHERAHLFERFFRGERRANIEGSGLGLSIVARAMQRSNGTVKLESAEAGDVRFLLCFPRAWSV